MSNFTTIADVLNAKGADKNGQRRGRPAGNALPQLPVEFRPKAVLDALEASDGVLTYSMAEMVDALRQGLRGSKIKVEGAETMIARRFRNVSGIGTRQAERFPQGVGVSVKDQVITVTDKAKVLVAA